jgi:hypothetical protein
MACCSVLCCHHPRKRMIQYPAPLKLNLNATEYWMPAFAGMTLRRTKPLRRPGISQALPGRCAVPRSVPQRNTERILSPPNQTISEPLRSNPKGGEPLCVFLR